MAEQTEQPEATPSPSEDEPWGADDTLLLLLDAPGPANGEPSIGGITKLTKLMFLADREAGFTGAENFPFVPHKYGPFSLELYHALRPLRDFRPDLDQGWYGARLLRVNGNSRCGRS